MAKPRPPGQKLSDTNPEAGPPASMKNPDNSLVSGPTFQAQKQPLAVKKTMLMGMEVMTEPIEGSTAMAEAKKLAESETGWYEQVRLLGEGGMGAVFEYRMKKFSSRGDKVADEPKAVKVVKFDDLLGDLEGEARDKAREELYRRFIVEVQLAYKLKHENIVRIEGFGEDFGKDNHPYYVMEFLKGQDLSKMIQENGPLPWKQALPIMRQACEGLEYAHNYVETDDKTEEEKKRPVVHRDIKPENIFIVTDSLGKQKVKILDFGIAKVVEESGKDPTHGGGVLGTPLYMAPEQAFGGTIDPRTDVYGLGSTMYHVLTERTVFLGDTINEVLAKLVSEERAVPLRERRPDLAIPAEAEQIIMKCIQKNPADRYQSMRDLWEDLRQREEMDTMEHARLQSGELSPAQSGEFAVNGNGVQAVNMEHPSHSLSQFGSVQVESPRKKRLGLIAGLVGVAAAGTITAAVLMNRSPNDEVKKTPASATRVVHDAKAPMSKPQNDARVKIVHVPAKEKERTVTLVTKLGGVKVFKGKKLLCTTAGKEGACTIKLEKNKALKVVLKKRGYKNKRYEILKDARGGLSVTLEKRWSSRRRRRRRNNMGIVISKPE